MHSVDAVNKHVEFTADMLHVDPATGAIWFNTDFESTSLPDANKWTKRLQQHLEDVHKNPETLPQGRRLGGAMSASIFKHIYVENEIHLALSGPGLRLVALCREKCY